MGNSASFSQYTCPSFFLPEEEKKKSLNSHQFNVAFVHRAKRDQRKAGLLRIATSDVQNDQNALASSMNSSDAIAYVALSVQAIWPARVQQRLLGVQCSVRTVSTA